VKDPHYKAREAIVEVPGRHGQPTPMQSVFPKLSRTPGQVRHVGSELGFHNREVLEQILGLSEAQIETLHNKNVI
ncbi:MAG TPA: CoA transferase, partial [Marinobacter sp.]|nr:CoA transferase [Marinobacter sp.]